MFILISPQAVVVILGTPQKTRGVRRTPTTVNVTTESDRQLAVVHLVRGFGKLLLECVSGSMPDAGISE